MQPVSGSGTPATGDRSAASPTSNATASTASSAAANTALTTAQRTTLETLVVKLQALTSLSSSAVWNNVRQDIGLPANQTLSTQHFPAAEKSLQAQITQAQSQNSADRQPLLQRITTLLPQGNNSQLVSQFLRQEFGHSALNSLTQPQLQRVLDLLQNTPGAATGNAANSAAATLVNAQGQNALNTLATSAAATALLQRPLSSAEQSGLNQMVARLSALMGEQPSKLWSSLMSLQQLTPGTPIPARNLPLLTQFLQAQTDLHHLLADAKASGATAQGGAHGSAATLNAAAHLPPSATMAALQHIIQPRLEDNELRLLQDFAQNRFNAGMQAPLTPMQLNEVITFLFSQRLQRIQGHPLTGQNLFPQPIVNPLIASLPPGWQALFHKPMFLPIVCTCVALFLLWVFLF